MDPTSDSSDPWRPPDEPERPRRTGLGGGLALALCAHLLATGIAVGPAGMGPTWVWGIGVLQVAYLAPMVAVAVAAGAGRPFVLGVFVGAAAAFVLQTLLWVGRLGFV